MPRSSAISLGTDLNGAVFSDLIDNKDFRPAVGGRILQKRQIIVDDATFGGASAGLVERSPLILTSDVRSRLRDDIVRRNPRGERLSIATYHPADRNVLVQALSDSDLDIEFADHFPSARGYIQSLLPGLTDNGQTALFGFYFGPSPHGAFGFYVLNRENGIWKIKQRSIGNFD